MASVRDFVSYCCISKEGQVLFTYSRGDHEIENLAALCLEMIPPYHRWYFQTMGKKTFGFLMDDAYAYFAIVSESTNNSGVLRFLQNLKDEFKKVNKWSGSSTRSLSCLNSPHLQEQLVPVVHYLIEHVYKTGTEWPADDGEVAPSPLCNMENGLGHMEVGTSTKAPLLGKPSKQEKKKKKMVMMKDHVIAMKGDIEMEEHRRSTERGMKVDSGALNPNNQGAGEAIGSPLRKDFNLTRTRSSTQNLQKKWCHQVRIVLAIDAAVCIILFVIWLIICHGTECIQRSS